MEWWVQVVDSSATVSWELMLAQVLVRLTLSLLFGLLVVWIYKTTRRSTTVTATFPATLVLLSILIAMVTQVIGDNIARAFSLVGALSVVRFRTVVRDTKDTAFVIVAVAVGMAIGLGQTTVAAFGVLTFWLAAFLFRDRAISTAETSRDMQIKIRLTWSPETEAAVLATLGKFATEIEATSAGTARTGVGMDLNYRLSLPPSTSFTQLIADLTRIEGVQSAELRKGQDDS